MLKLLLAFGADCVGLVEDRRDPPLLVKRGKGHVEFRDHTTCDPFNCCTARPARKPLAGALEFVG
ncbi:hypothetical protein GCM10025781_04300 [Kocuria gwangalliensis]|uniref:Uncharacterized protein n=1 Tax=Kocuria gwangalliensis TaxID=501592 RepID=A0ABP8WKM6_9MICC